MAKDLIWLQDMTADHKKRLQENTERLKRELKVEELLDHLVQKDDFFNKNRWDRVRADEIRADKVERLLGVLSSGSEYTWNCFMDALDSTEQTSIRAYLEGNGTDNVGLQVKQQASTNQNLTNTDQPYLTVKHTTDSFYNEHKSEAYSMHKKSRGHVFIINVKTVKGHKPRYGTDNDRDNLKRLFNGLHFEVMVYNDADGLTAKDIRNKMKTFAELPGHQHAQCVVLCFLSHGGDGYILGTDAQKVNIMEIRNCFNNANCRALMHKPKLLFFQACRGANEDFGVDTDDASGDRQPTHGDMLIGFPTPPGYCALRDCLHGSWYISALVKVFAESAWNTDILKMMCQVRNLLGRKESEIGHKMVSEEVVLLKKTFYFFPGITRD